MVLWGEGMKRRLFSVLAGFLIIVGSFPFVLSASRIRPSQGEIPIASSQASFTSIQYAINEAENGSTIVVPSGIYYEHVVVNKSISLFGENLSTTIIDGGNASTVVEVTADNVAIVGFTIRNSGWGWTRNGILVHLADNCEIRNNRLVNNCHNVRLNYSSGSLVISNVIEGNGYGIRLINAVDCIAADNNISGCIGAVHLEFATSCTVKRNTLTRNDQGIRMYSPCAYNNIVANNVSNNNYDGMIDNSMNGNATFLENFIFHNNFVNNTYPFICKGSGNIWDDGYPSGGNYWSRYNGTDLYHSIYQNETGCDGIGDTSYQINSDNIDQYPLMQQWNALPVCNTNTAITYASIQEAIDAPETLGGHTLWVESGSYLENVIVRKPITLVGENEFTTIIDGRNAGTVLCINSDNVTIVGFTIRNSGSNYPPYGMDCGVLLNHTVGCSVAGCLVTNNRIGIYASFSTFNTIANNTIHTNYENGIWLWYSGHSALKGNNVSGNKYNFGIFGSDFSDFNNLVDTSNSADGKFIQYIVGAHDEILTQTDTGTLYLINCVNVTVRDLSLTGNGHGIFCYNVTNSRIENVSAARNNYGIYLQRSDGNTIRNSNCLDDWVGICVEDAKCDVVEGNVATECGKGISLYGADNNSLIGNNLQNNLYGIRLFSSSFNRILHNNLIENAESVSLISSYENVWDNGCEGNYWSNYNGTDLDLDGVGDTCIPWEAVDCYPLMGPYVAGDINHDGVVNILDVVETAVFYGSTPSSPDWNPHADIAEPYGVIDILDLVTCTFHYGEKYQWRSNIQE
jgi:parallel beta-helix repeat protein